MKLTSVVLFLLASPCLFGQSISGKILDIEGNPVPYANIFIKNTESGTSSGPDGSYYIQLLPGNYDVVVSAIGYKTIDRPVILTQRGLKQDFIMEIASTELEQVIVRAKRRDPAYEIIQWAIEHREINQASLEEFKCNIYIKAEESRNMKEALSTPENPEAPSYSMEDFDMEQKPETPPLPDISLNESEIELSVKLPNGFKEVKKASKTVGTPSGLFIPRLYRDKFDFYEGLVHPKAITQTPWISPLNRTSVLSYKFKLLETYYLNNTLVYRIKVQPRKKGNNTLEGEIIIQDSLWNIVRVELGTEKGGLTFFDQFKIDQEYEQVDGFWVLKREEFTYSTNSRKKEYAGKTLLRYYDYDLNPSFPDNYFGNEVGYAERDAYKKDTTYWKETRKEALTPEQRRVINYNDSVKAVTSSHEYIDSLNALYNKIKLVDVFYYGVGFRNREKKRDFRFSSIGESVNPVDVGGFRIQPGFFMNKIRENGERFSWSASPSYGLRNKDMKGSSSLWYNYNPWNFSSIAFGFSRRFDFINPNDAYLEMIKRNNFFDLTTLYTWHTFEPVNGIRIFSRLDWSVRRSIEGLEFGELSERFLENQETTPFDNHAALVSTVSFSYTPAQKYYNEPNRKIILGSKYPTFTLTHKKGWKNVAQSSLDYDFLSFTINQRIDIRSLGNSIYNIRTGTFFNDREVRLLDYQRFRRGDPFLFSDPKSTFQLLDDNFEITGLFVEGHYIHHFNGALINNIPLVKKLRLGAVAGAGFLYIPEENYNYAELFAGAERIFKLGPRRRLKVGGYVVGSESNRSSARLGWKISFDIIDTWRTNWNF